MPYSNQNINIRLPKIIEEVINDGKIKQFPRVYVTNKTEE